MPSTSEYELSPEGEERLRRLEETIASWEEVDLGKLPKGKLKLAREFYDLLSISRQGFLTADSVHPFMRTFRGGLAWHSQAFRAPRSLVARLASFTRRGLVVPTGGGGVQFIHITGSGNVPSILEKGLQTDHYGRADLEPDLVPLEEPSSESRSGKVFLYTSRRLGERLSSSRPFSTSHRPMEALKVSLPAGCPVGIDWELPGLSFYTVGSIPPRYISRLPQGTDPEDLAPELYE